MTNKCSNDDLAYFVSECGDILGISDKIKSKSDPKAIISYVLTQLVNLLSDKALAQKYK